MLCMNFKELWDGSKNGFPERKMVPGRGTSSCKVSE